MEEDVSSYHNNGTLYLAEDVSSATDKQEKVLSILPILSSILSIWGSGNIIWMVATAKKCTPYRRILLGLSVCDCVASIVWPLQAFLVPAATSQRVWAAGNAATCTALGWFQTASFSNVWYSGMLSFYFCLTVRWGIRQEVLARRYEPWMHLLSVGWPLVTASIGAGMGVYDEVKVGSGCWITNYPKGCGCNELDTGECCTSPLIAWVFAGIPAFLMFFVVLVNNLLVYLHVRSTIQRSRQGMDESVKESIRQSTKASSGGQRRRDQQAQRIRAVGTQSFLYVAAFLVCQTPALTLRIMESRNFDAEDEYQLFPLLVVNAILVPLVGFFNCLIYVRPSYLRVRKSYPNEGRFWAFRRALHGDRVMATASKRHGGADDDLGMGFSRMAWSVRRGANPPAKAAPSPPGEIVTTEAPRDSGNKNSSAGISSMGEFSGDGSVQFPSGKKDSIGLSLEDEIELSKLEHLETLARPKLARGSTEESLPWYQKIMTRASKWNLDVSKSSQGGRQDRSGNSDRQRASHLSSSRREEEEKAAANWISDSSRRGRGRQSPRRTITDSKTEQRRRRSPRRKPSNVSGATSGNDEVPPLQEFEATINGEGNNCNSKEISLPSLDGFPAPTNEEISVPPLDGFPSPIDAGVQESSPPAPGEQHLTQQGERIRESKEEAKADNGKVTDNTGDVEVKSLPSMNPFPPPADADGEQHKTQQGEHNRESKEELTTGIGKVMDEGDVEVNSLPSMDAFPATTDDAEESSMHPLAPGEQQEAKHGGKDHGECKEEVMMNTVH